MDVLDDFLLDQILRTNENDQVLNLENNEVEYKRSFDWSNNQCKQKCLKELAALSNAGGGYLIYGVDDTTGELIGEDKSEDLANISDAYSRQFSPTIQMKGRTFEVNGIPLFVIYAAKYETLPSVCIKEFEGVKNGVLLYRYSSKSAPIKGVDLINLMQSLRQDTATEKLISTQQENRRKDLMPYFHINGGTRNGLKDFSVRFKNKGKKAHLLGLIPFKDSNVYLNSNIEMNSFVDESQTFQIRGRFKENVINISHCNYSFRLFFEDIDEYIYFQEFHIQRSNIKNHHPKPELSSKEGLEEFKEIQKE